MSNATTYMIVRWPDGLHESKVDDRYERDFTRDNGGEVLRANIDTERMAYRLAQRYDDTEWRKEEHH